MRPPSPKGGLLDSDNLVFALFIRNYLAKSLKEKKERKRKFKNSFSLSTPLIS
jgi:hypothetical protein